MAKKDTGNIDLNGKDVLSDPAMEKVIAAQAKVNELKREVSALRKDREQLLEEYADAQQARKVLRSPSSRPKAGKADTVRMVFGDVHGMRMDHKAVNAVLQDIRLFQPDEIVLLGDIVECGGWLAKHQPVGFVASCDYSYQEDIQAADWFLEEIQMAAPEAVIHYIEGNHEDRVERWVVDQVSAHKREAEFLLNLCGPRQLLRIEDRGIHWYSRHEAHVAGLPRGWIKLDKMHYTHSLTYSKNAARQAAERAAGNVTYGCTHRADTATIILPAVGIVKAFNPGCLSQMQPIWRHSDPTGWSQGYNVEFIARSGNFQVVPVPIWRGESLAGAMIDRLTG